MADLDLLKALQGSLYSPSETMGGIGAQAIGASLPALYNPYQSDTQNIGLSIGGGLLAGLLGGYGKYQAQQENAALQPQIAALMSGSPGEQQAIAASNPRLSPLVSALAMQDYTDKREYQKAIQNKELDLGYIPKMEVAKLRATAPLELEQKLTEKLGDISMDQGLVPSLDGSAPTPFGKFGLKTPEEIKVEEANAMIAPEVEKIRQIEEAKADIEKASLGFSPKKAKAEDDARAEIEKIPSVAQFQTMQKALPKLETLAPMTTKSSDIPFIYAYVKAADDTAVKEGEVNMTQSANPLIQKWMSKLESAWNGESELGPELKKQMLNELKQTQGAAYGQALKDAKQRADIFTRRGLDENNIYPIDRKLTFGGSSTGGNLITAPDGQQIIITD